MARKRSGGITREGTLPTPSNETMDSLLELASLIVPLTAGPYGYMAVSIIRVLNSFRNDYKIAPEFEKYFEAMKRIAEGQRRRWEAKEGKTW